MIPYTIKTPHYTYILYFESKPLNYLHKFLVGNDRYPCLEAYVHTENAPIFYNPHICNLQQILISV